MKSATVLFAAVAVASGCGATVSSSVSPGTNLSQYRTFSFYSSPYKQGRPESLADQEIRAALKQDLSTRGMTESMSGPGDFLVAYHVVEQQKLEADAVGYGFIGFGGVDLTTYTR